jgi:hypothetical protein
MRVSQRHRALGSVKRGKERDLNPSRSTPNAPDRHPNGPGHRPGARKRIEQVARQGSTIDVAIPHHAA